MYLDVINIILIEVQLAQVVHLAGKSVSVMVVLVGLRFCLHHLVALILRVLCAMMHG